MQFIILAEKQSGADDLRSSSRVEHLEFMIAHQDKVNVGGAITDEHGEWNGMALVLDAPDEASVRAWLTEEPYNRAGVFGSVRVFSFDQRTPEPEDGWLAAQLVIETQRRRDAEAGAQGA